MKKTLGIILSILLFFSALFLLFYLKANFASYKGTLIEASEVEGSLYTVHVPDYYFESQKEGSIFLSSVDPWKGSLDAKDILIVFASMGPESSDLYQVINQLLEERGDNLAVFWKDYPVDEAAKFKAEEAHCAGEQDKFWDYADQEILGEDNDFFLEETDFNNCLKSDEMLSLVNNNYYYARSLGIEEGPVVYLNDEKIEGDLNYQNINNKINYVVQEN